MEVGKIKMKVKAILIILLFLPCMAFYSQNSVTKKSVEKNIVKSKKILICSNEERTKWFAIFLSYRKTTKIPMVNGLKVIKSNIGTYKNRGNDLMVFYLSDNTHIRIKARSGLLQDSTIEFDLSNKDIDALLTKSVITIRYINGIDYKSMFYQTVGDEKLFFYNELTF